MIKRILQALILPICSLLTLISCSSSGKQDFIYSSYLGVPLSGNDPVSFFITGELRRGNAELFRIYKGKKFYFSSGENFILFSKNPKKYAPQYGGHCAYSVAKGIDVKGGDSTFWRIINGKLYILENKEALRRWQQDIPGYIKLGDINWKKKYGYSETN